MNIKIRKFKDSDILGVVSLIKETFYKYNKKEATKTGIKNYLTYYSINKDNLEKVKISFLKTPIFFVSLDNKKIVGMIRGTKSYMVNLFVNGNYHNQGIGRELVNKFENEAKKQVYSEIKIRASLFAVPFYQKIGYKKTTGIKNYKGIKVYPMKKLIF